MLTPRQNRLLPIITVIVLLLLILIMSRSCSDKVDNRVVLDRVPQVSRPDADTPADTIETLTANVAAMTRELEALREANARLRADNETLRDNRRAMEEAIASRIDREFTERNRAVQERREEAFSSLNARVDALAEAVNASGDSQVSDIPIGLGWDPAFMSTDLVWIEPLDGTAGDIADEFLEGSDRSRNALAAAAGASRTTDSEDALAQQPQPVYTVPRNATLMGATAMTALVGRVPVRGEVRDPMPFKVITGRDNMAANGLTVPGVAGMVWSGTAIGDWTLSCVTGRLESVTFVFDDGTIRTLSTDDREAQSGARNRPLGWISDARGIPCVSGERKSNAAAFLSQRIGSKAIEAAARAAGASETTTVIPASGGITHSVTGDTGAYVLGQTVAQGGEEIAQWLLERQAQNFDAVFVPAGTELAIHVDHQLTIDHDPNGRRLHHAMLDPTDAAHGLD